MRPPSSTRGVPLPGLLPALAVPIAGACAGFFAWSLAVADTTFHSYLFFNNLTAAERGRLASFLAAGAVLFLAAFGLLILLLPRGRPGTSPGRMALYFSAGILLGFWPPLAVQAIEVYHPYYVFLLVAGFIAAATVLAYQLSRQTREAPRLAPGKERQADRLCLTLLALLTASYALFFSLYTVLKHRAFHSYAFDLGWQHQVFHTLLHTGFPTVTIYVTIDHLANHFQPLYYLLAPIYALHQDASTLLVIQAVALSSAALPIYLLARRKVGEPWTALILAVVYLLYPALHGLNTYDFHGLVFLIPFVCFLLYFLEIRNYRLFWIFFALALITREDTAVTLSGVGLYLLLERERRRLGLIVLGVCVAYFLLATTLMSALGGCADLSNYQALWLPERQSFSGVLITLITNPQFALKRVFLDPAKLEYLLHLLLPLLFLPLLAGRSLLLLLPGLAVILLSNNSPQYTVGFQYPSHLIPLLFFLSACSIQTMRRRWSAIRLPLLALPLLLAGIMMNLQFGLVLSKRFPGFPRVTARQRTAYSFFEQIPPEASLTTSSRLLPHLAGRRRLHLWQAPHPDTDYILVDLHPPEPALDLYETWYQRQNPGAGETRSYLLGVLASGDYGVLRFEDDFILLEKGHPASANDSVAGTILSTDYGENPTVIDYYSDPAKKVDPPRFSQSDLLLSLLERNSRDTLLLAAHGDAAARLSYLCKKYLMMRGSRINTLHRGGSYLAVMHRDRIVLELIDNDRPVEVHSAGSALLESLLPDLELALYSSGGAGEPRASIRVAGREYAPNRPGLNVLVLDSRGRVLKQEVFNTGK